jgi:hypothetical protein
LRSWPILSRSACQRIGSGKDCTAGRHRRLARTHVATNSRCSSPSDNPPRELVSRLPLLLLLVAGGRGCGAGSSLGREGMSPVLVPHQLPLVRIQGGGPDQFPARTPPFLRCHSTSNATSIAMSREGSELQKQKYYNFFPPQTSEP